MSIPGLGQLAPKPAPSATRTITLQPLWEYRFETPHGSSNPLTITLLTGTAERDGTELATNVPYQISGAKSKILSWRGATLEVDGAADDYVAETADPNAATDDAVPTLSYLNLHGLLQRQREAAVLAMGQQQQQQGQRHAYGKSAARSTQTQTFGPRVLIAGPASSGRTTLVRTLAAWATRTGSYPVVVNADPREGVLTLPGTLSAAVFSTVMDVASEAGWGAAPSSGPSSVPVKLPLVYYYGRQRAEEDLGLYKGLVSALAGAVSARALDDSEVRTAGVLVDAPPYTGGGGGVETVAHLVEELSINIVVVLGSARLTQELTKRFSSMRTSLDEPISVVTLDKSDGVVERDEGFLQHARESSIKEYFFGDARITLSPFTQQVGFDDVAIYMSPDPTAHRADDNKVLERVEPVPSMAHWTLAIMNASLSDPPEKIRYASAMGFVYVAGVDKDRRRLKILAPVSGRVGEDKPLVWGKWPEPHINLLG